MSFQWNKFIAISITSVILMSSRALFVSICIVMRNTHNNIVSANNGRILKLFNCEMQNRVMLPA
jgi:hypothetical protein